MKKYKQNSASIPSGALSNHLANQLSGSHIDQLLTQIYWQLHEQLYWQLTRKLYDELESLTVEGD